MKIIAVFYIRIKVAVKKTFFSFRTDSMERHEEISLLLQFKVYLSANV